VADLRDVSRQGAVLAAIQPQFHHYQLLKNGLARYRRLAQDTTLVQLPPIPPDVRPGQVLHAAPALRRRLRATGDLAKGKDPKAERDTVYTPELVDAVQRFQVRQGFLPDGVLWSQTIEQLERPLSERVRQIELTLERWRWLPSTFDVPPVIVNIPAFRLYAFNAPPDRRENMLTMDVLVGAAVWNDTTVFSAPMTHVIFRPYWEVPSNLMLYELGPRALADRENMERQGYVLVRSDGSDSTGLPLTPENLERLGKGLRMRQRPGPYNSLGLIKFMLPNPYDIYLHDTPVPGLFMLPRRDFSHGCIRVSDPVALAVHVLRGQPGWTAERVKAAMESGEDNLRVDLPQPVPVFIVYATADASETGEVHFYTDIYKRDARLDALLKKVAPFPRTSSARKKG
jgi:murein L,D-transpeptidase YcbB/YkuD